MKRVTILCLILVAFIAVSSMATAADPSWIVRGSYVKTWPSTDSYQTESVIGDNPLLNELSLDSGQGFGFDLEYKMSPKLGIVLLGIFTDMEGTFVAGLEPGEESDLVTDNNTVDVYTVNFGANYHFTPESRVDFYAGAYLGWFSYDSIKFRLPIQDEEIAIDPIIGSIGIGYRF